ncbi:hypothetical protein EDD68_11254 [Melghiribacillus thermohalophilus]|uniref:Uncharacterized protein n=1 Tax=Melghiribacillus thermohalophilus TaxID=1324956 RepID=A0A4R3MZ87_9BACI|nr:hypothetical protein [Melghiribacillus thermohalophilus]TCT20926.1 hypothetical protein EDD68_11254 [Melghiribacillus thermohalophilus]
MSTLLNVMLALIPFILLYTFFAMMKLHDIKRRVSPDQEVHSIKPIEQRKLLLYHQKCFGQGPWS